MYVLGKIILKSSATSVTTLTHMDNCSILTGLVHGMALLKTLQMPTLGPKEYSLHAVGLLLHTAAQIVLTPPAPRNGCPFLPFLGRPAKCTRWLAGAAAIKSG